MEIIIILILIAFNGLFALSEIALVSANRDTIIRYKDQGKKNADLVLGMMDNPDMFLSSIQVGITLIGIISGAFSGIALSHKFASLLNNITLIQPYSSEIAIIIVVSFVTYFSIIFGELVPKTIALRNPEKLILFVIPIINVFSTITHPIVHFLSFSTRAVIKIFGIKLESLENTEDPIEELVGNARLAVIKNRIHREQERIITNTVKIQTLTVGELMVKRQDIKFLCADMSLNDALIEAHIHHHTRFPLLDKKGSENIIGYVNFKDIINVLRINPQNPSLKNISRPITSIRSDEKVPDALRRLIREHQHIALVKDTRQNIIGMISLENLVETIVGDIRDEYDILPEYLYNITENRFICGGGALLQNVNKIVSDKVPDLPITVNQWILGMVKTVRVELELKYENLSIIIRKVSRGKVTEVIIDRIPQ